MNIKNLIKSLIPSIEKRTILEDIVNGVGELKTSTIPVYKSATETFNKVKFKNADVLKFVKQFDRDNRTGIKGNFIAVIYEVAKRTEQNGETLTKITESVYENDVVATGLTYRKANLLQYIESLCFFQRYARKLLLWVYTLETADLEVGPDTIARTLTEGDTNWLKENSSAFITLLEPLAFKPIDIEKAIANIPDLLIIADNVDTVNQTVGAKIDPFKMNFIPAKLNMIYHIRMRVAEWQNWRYQVALQEKKSIEFRLLHLQNKIDGKVDPKIESLIEYNEARLDKMNYKIRKMEEANG